VVALDGNAELVLLLSSAAHSTHGQKCGAQCVGTPERLEWDICSEGEGGEVPECNEQKVWLLRLAS
jgi:hypothetical protein